MLGRLITAIALGAIAGCLGASAGLQAQTVRGQVLEAATGTPVDAGFVLLLGPDGKEMRRTLADRSGRFSIRAPGPGQYRLRSERIGYRVVTSPPLELSADQTLDYTLAVRAVPIRLEEIRVERETKCRVRPEEGQATATVWDEARKALAAVAWVQSQQRLRVRIRTFERELSPELRVRKEESRERSGASNRPFRALSPRDLAARGYIERTTDGGFLFQGPDADVLFSDEFLNQHCFRLEQQRDSTTMGMVGLGFEPVGGHNLPDIKGVMWVDEKSAELRYVEYRYTRFDFGIDTDVAGGRVEFQ
ncbi:MAG: carboxypeptidase regulatory-like domain-containing protein, partial [Gemmatimonadetes bacterium]|nr:carboxypeptidase regulatory-like domain-containing protein [Gemmatimonadota bacterium]